MRGYIITCFTICALLLGTGCSAMLEREYVRIVPHSATQRVEGESSDLRAENYQELVNALLYFVVTGEENGAIRLYNYPKEEAELDLPEACYEVTREDPLGAYSVEDIQYQLSTIVAYDEANIQITYRRDRNQVESIIPVTGTSAIRREISKGMANFDEEIVLKAMYFDGNMDQIQTLIRQAYYETADAALGMPTTTIHLYPETGLHRIVEINVTYPMEQSELERRSEQLRNQVKTILDAPLGTENDDILLAIGQLIMGQGGLKPEIGSTAYHAIVAGGSDPQGLAMAMSLLCQEMNIYCVVVEGTLNEVPHHWNIVMTPWGYRHLDLSAYQLASWEDAQSAKNEAYHPFLSDSVALEVGYLWDTRWVPPCGQQSD